jgi:hypothetical protein
MPWGGGGYGNGVDQFNPFNTGRNGGSYRTFSGSGSYQRPYDRDSDTYAQDMRAFLAREEYNDYLTRFAPVESDLIDSVMGTEMLEERLSAISVNSNTARKTAENNMQMVSQRYGVTQSNQQMQQNNMAMDRTQAIAEANGMNQTRTHIFDRNMNALAGGSGAIRGTIQGGYGGGN